MYIWSTLSCVNVRLRLRASSSLPGSTMFHLWGEGMCAEHPGTRASSCLLRRHLSLVTPAVITGSQDRTKMPFPADWLRLNSSVDQPFLTSGPWVG